MYGVGGSGLDEMEAFLQKEIGRYPSLIWAGECVPMMGGVCTGWGVCKSVWGGKGVVQGVEVAEGQDGQHL